MQICIILHKKIEILKLKAFYFASKLIFSSTIKRTYEILTAIPYKILWHPVNFIWFVFSSHKSFSTTDKQDCYPPPDVIRALWSLRLVPSGPEWLRSKATQGRLVVSWALTTTRPRLGDLWRTVRRIAKLLDEPEIVMKNMPRCHLKEDFDYLFIYRKQVRTLIEALENALMNKRMKTRTPTVPHG